MAHWIGAQGQSKWVKKSKTPPLCDDVPREPQTQINKFYKSKLEDLMNP